MRIWVDADACPKVIKEILFRAAVRTNTVTTLISNQLLTIPRSPFIKKMQVSLGFDVADNRIVQDMEAGDLVITADIPLADAVVHKKGIALNPRGELYTPDNIKQRLAVRNINEELRGNGINIGGPPKMSNKEVQAFANKLDSWISSIARQRLDV